MTLGSVPYGVGILGASGGGSSSTGTAWGSGVSLMVEVDFSQAVDDPGSFTTPFNLWDGAVWDDTDYSWSDSTVWTDVTEWTLSVSTSRKFSKAVQTYGAGSLRLTLDNNDGRFSPLNTLSPYRIGDSTAIGMLRPIRVSLRYGSLILPLFTGRIETWDDTYDGGFLSTVSVDAVDMWAELGAFDSYEQAPAGAGDTYAARIGRLLDNAGYSGPRVVDVGEHTFQATTLAANALTELKLTADSEGGAVWAGADGTFYADGQNALIEKDRSNTVQVTFTDVDDVTAVGYGLASTSAAYDASKVVNVAAYARVGSTVQVETAETSRTLYGNRQATRTDLVCETDGQVATLAARDIAVWQDPERRMDSLTFSPLHQPTPEQIVVAWDAVARDLIALRSLVRVVRHPPGGYEINKLQYVSGISHTIGSSSWKITVEFSDASVIAGMVASRWDVGVWDEQTWSW